MNEEALQDLLDKEAIRETLHRYSRGVDRADVDMLASAYHADAVDEHGSAHFEGESIAPGILEMVARSRVSSHQLANVSVALQSSDQAAAETYYTAWQSMVQDGEERMLFSVGRYVDRIEKRSGEWRIAARKVIVEHAQLLPADGVFPRMGGPVGSHDREDPSYEVLRSPPPRERTFDGRASR